MSLNRILIEQSIRDYKSKGASWQTKNNYKEALHLWGKARRGAKVLGRVDGDEDEYGPVHLAIQEAPPAQRR